MDEKPIEYEAWNEGELVRQAQAGKRSAFDRVSRRWRPILTALALTRTGDLDAAMDIAQEALVRAWEKLPALQDPNAFGPWLKTITANACASRRRRVQVSTVPIADLPEAAILAQSGLTPLDILLADERQERLSAALLRLPEANRTALIAHIWHGEAYGDIAKRVGVSASTVDGCIRRAKKRLRGILTDHAFGLSEPAKQISEIRRRKMTGESKNGTAVRPRLLEFIDRLATLIETGVTMDRALEALCQDPPYGPAAIEMRAEIAQAEEVTEPRYYMAESYYLDLLHSPHTYPKLMEQLEHASRQKTALLPSRSQALSEAMTKRPTLFPPFLTALVRAGEIRGLLDITLRRAQELLEKDWELGSRRAKGQPVQLVLTASETSLPGEWQALTAYQQKQLLAIFLRTFGALLVSGVPILQAMQTMNELLPKKQAEGWINARNAVQKGECIIPALRQMAIFPDFSLALIGAGEEGGFLDTSLERSADLVEREMARERLLAEG